VSSSIAPESGVAESTALRLRSMRAWLAVIALTAIWFALAAGRPLSHPDEGRYAEIPREMLAHGDWVIPHLNGLAYIEKPPLQYWATAIAYRLMGPNEWTARLWTMLSAWLNVALVFLLGRRVWNLRTGVIAAAMLASTVLHFVLGQLLTLDMAFACLLTAALCAFCMAQLTRDAVPRESGRWMLATWAMLALAVLTKGIVALVIAGSVLSIYMLWQRDWTVWRTLRPVAGLALLAVITAPWFVLAARADPDFLQFFFIHEHFQRYLTDEAQRVEPWWYFLVVLAIGVLPWLPQMFSALLNGWRANAERGQFDVRRLLWLWCVFVVVFFSLSGSKLAPYVLPVLPPLALLTATRESSGPVRWLNGSAWMLLASALGLALYVLIAPFVSDDAVVLRMVQIARPAALTFGVVAALAAFLCRQATRRQQPVHALVSVAAGWFLGLALVFATVGQESSLRSGRELAAQVPADLIAHAPLFSVQTYDQSLPFYLRRTMILVDTRGELDYGLQHEPDKGISDMGVFEQRWSGLPQAVAIMSHSTYSHLAARGLPMRVLGKDRRRVAVARR
jgi:4-amino-4-deoxy-L-arabinose transferase-like glycosyltransferase